MADLLTVQYNVYTLGLSTIYTKIQNILVYVLKKVYILQYFALNFALIFLTHQILFIIMVAVLLCRTGAKK